MEKMNRPVRRPGQRTAAPRQKQSPLRAVTDGEFKRREPLDLSVFRQAKTAEELDAEAAPKAEVEQVAQRKSDGWLDTVLGALQGEFNDSPTTPQLFLDLGIGMVPVAGEVTDLRDISAVLIRMVSSGVYSEWGDWLAIALSSIGLVPVVGGFLKGFAKIARAGKIGDLVSRGDEFFALISRFGLSAGSFHTQMMGMWSNAAGQAVANFNRILDIINAASFRIFNGKIRSIREAGNSLLGSALDEIGAMIDEAAAEVQRLLGGQGELATAGGPPGRRVPDSPSVDSHRMENRGSGETTSGGARVPWRGTPQLLDGTRRWGWTHIEGRHITGTISGTVTDLFPPGTTRTQIQEAIEEVVENGVRTSDPSAVRQTFERRIIVNGRRDRVKVVIDTSNNGRVVTAFPVRSQ